MKDIIKTFAVDLLGCGCGSEVFERIDVSDDSFDGACGRGKRILIGNRLLIYLAPWDGRDDLAGHAASLMRRGKEERDKNGYNRFRLVLAADSPVEVSEQADGLLKSFVGNDEKLHFHVLPSDNDVVRRILRWTGGYHA